MATTGRGPAKRDDFMDDIHVLILLQRAVKGDTRRPQDWRNKIAAQLHTLMDELLNAPNPFGLVPDTEADATTTEVKAELRRIGSR